MTMWNGVIDAGTNFINLLSGGGVASMKALAVKSFQMTPSDMTVAFGPPSDASTMLPEMSATTGQIVTNFNKILTLLFIKYMP